MNTTTTPDPLALVLPALEVSGARLTGYLSVVGMVVMHYDFLLTFKDEVRLIFRTPASFPPIFLQVRLVWPGSLSLPKVLYYLNRYISIVAIIFCNYGLSHPFLHRSMH